MEDERIPASHFWYLSDRCSNSSRSTSWLANSAGLPAWQLFSARPRYAAVGGKRSPPWDFDTHFTRNLGTTSKNRASSLLSPILHIIVQLTDGRQLLFRVPFNPSHPNLPSPPRPTPTSALEYSIRCATGKWQPLSVRNAFQQCPPTTTQAFQQEDLSRKNVPFFPSTRRAYKTCQGKVVTFSRSHEHIKLVKENLSLFPVHTRI